MPKITERSPIKRGQRVTVRVPVMGRNKKVVKHEGTVTAGVPAGARQGDVRVTVKCGDGRVRRFYEKWCALAKARPAQRAAHDVVDP